MFNREIRKLLKANHYSFFELSPLMRTLGDTGMLLIDTLMKQSRGENQNKEDALFQIKTNLLFVTKEYFRIVNAISMDKLKHDNKMVTIS